MPTESTDQTEDAKSEFLYQIRIQLEVAGNDMPFTSTLLFQSQTEAEETMILLREAMPGVEPRRFSVTKYNPYAQRIVLPR